MTIINAITPNAQKNRISQSIVDYGIDYSQLREEYDDLLQLAKFVIGDKKVFLNIIDANYVWVVTTDNNDLLCFDIDETVCQHTVKHQKPVEINNLRNDPCFGSLPHIVDAGLEYYYGQQLQTCTGYNLGVLCIVDTFAIALTSDQKDALERIAKQITERIEYQKELDSLKTQLHNIDIEKRALVHDIRGPIAGMIGLATVALDEIREGDSTDIQSYFNLIKASGNAVIEIADELLKDDQDAVTSELTSLSILSHKMESLFMPKIVNKELLYHVVMSDNTADVPIRKGKILQILSNLLSNAVKFTPSGGSIDLTMTLSETQPREIVLTVKDSGRGIDDRLIAQFNNGHVISKSGTDGESGYGMGVALIKRLVDDAKGKITIESDLNHGTTFIITMIVE